MIRDSLNYERYTDPRNWRVKDDSVLFFLHRFRTSQNTSSYYEVIITRRPVAARVTGYGDRKWILYCANERDIGSRRGNNVLKEEQRLFQMRDCAALTGVEDERKRNRNARL